MNTVYKKKARPRWLWPLLLLALACVVSTASAQPQSPKKAKPKKSVYDYVPYGYERVGDTQLYYYQSEGSSTIDLVGEFDGTYYSSTYSNGGYNVAIQVGDNEAVSVDELPWCGGSEDTDPIAEVPMMARRMKTELPSSDGGYGMEVKTFVEQQGEFARVCYVVTNNNYYDETVSMGVHADVMIGDNDQAPITRRVDGSGNTYGLTMKDGNGAELCVLFGSGLSGVAAVDDYWFGFYYLNEEAYEMVGNYGDYGEEYNYMQEDGSYDSGMGWCWKDRLIPAGESVTFSYLIGVGDVNLEPGSTYVIIPEATDDWNDLSKAHNLIVTGVYESPAGLDGIIDYSVEGSSEWVPLTGTLKSGDEFTETLVALFDDSRTVHTIRFRTRDLVGNTTTMRPVEFIDVRTHTLEGLEEKTYTGDSIFQDALICDLEEGWYDTSHYVNNVNAGTATVFLEGVFPYTIGRKPYYFTIKPAELEGSVVVTDEGLAYTGENLTPAWQFTVEKYATLVEGRDYTVTWGNNKLPGDATLVVDGKGNYIGTLTATFHINKIQLPKELLQLTLPEEDVTYDGKSHRATLTILEGMGEVTFTYVSEDGTYNSTEPPIEEGTYQVYLEISEGDIYYAMERQLVGSFTILLFDPEEWNVLGLMAAMLENSGWEHPWDMSAGMKNVSTFDGLTVKNGHVVEIDLSNRNITADFPIFTVFLKRLEKLNLSHNNFYTSFFSIDIFGEEMFSSLTSLDISYNQLEGNIGFLTKNCPKLVSLDASHNHFSEVSPMISPNVTDLNLGNQEIKELVRMTVAQLMEADIEEHIPSIITYDHANQTFKRDIDLVLSDDDSPWMLRLNYGEDVPQVQLASNDFEYKKNSGEHLTATVVGGTNTSNGDTFTLALEFLMGDADFSGYSNVLDLQAIINYVFKDYGNRTFNHTAADMWVDALINVQDVVKMVGLLLDMNDSDVAKAYAMRRIPSAETSGEADIHVDGDKLVINSAKPVAAFDIVVDGCKAAELTKDLAEKGVACSIRIVGDACHLVGYSLTGATLPVGQIELCTLKGEAPVIRKAMLADKNAEEIAVRLELAPTVIAQAKTDFDIILSNGKLLLRHSSPLTNVNWVVSDLSGCVLAKGTLATVQAGLHVLDMVQARAASTLIVRLNANECKETRRKIIMK